jgi:diguanylate cyclase (GGDEF)-like protein
MSILRSSVAISAGVIVAVIGVDFAVERLVLVLPAGTPLWMHASLERGGFALVIATLLWVGALNPLRRLGSQQGFETKIARALEMTSDEQAAYNVVRKTLDRELPRLSAELLLADSSEAHLKQAVAVGRDGRGPECRVGAPRDCPAVRRAQTLIFSTSEAIDACPFLEGREDGELAATCVPLSVSGRSIGVLHATTPVSRPVRPVEVARLEALANHTGGRLGMLRVLVQTHLQAATDPLTGLLNRRAFENQAQELLRRGSSFAVAMGDLDHFKVLNDTFGHEAGDRALRLFARTIRDTLRGDDLVSRFGGEEFIFAFPGRSATEAAIVLERLRAHLRDTLAAGTVPPFTASFGVAHSDDAPALEDLFRIADAALFRAKREGRDRVLVDSIVALHPKPDDPDLRVA